MTKNKQEGVWITDIIWENFLAYGTGAAHITDLTVINGDRNGAGKTSVAQALCYALTGDLLTNITPADAVRNGAMGLSVVVRGTKDGTRFELVRKFKLPNNRSLQLAYFSPDRVDVDNPAEELSRLISSSEFGNLIYINGHNLDALIAGSAAERSRRLDEQFGIEHMRKIVDCTKISEIVKQQKAFEKELLAKQTQLNGIRQILMEVSEQGSLQRDIDATTTQIDECTLDVERKAAILQPLEDQIAQITSYNATIERLDEKIARIQPDIARMQEEIDELGLKRTKIQQLLTTKLLHPNETPELAKARLMNEITHTNDEITRVIQHRTEQEYVEKIQSFIHITQPARCPVCASPIDLEMIQKPDASEDPMPTLIARRDALQSQTAMLDRFTTQIDVLIAHERDKSSQISSMQNAIDQLMYARNSILKPTPIDTTAIANARADHRRAMDRLVALQTHKRAQEARLAAVRMQPNVDASLTSTLEHEIAMLQNELVRVAKKRLIMDHLREGFLAILSKLRQETLNELNPRIQMFIDMMMPPPSGMVRPIMYEIQLEKKTTAGQDSYIYTDVVRRFDARVKFDALSTGQRAICAIAFILAMTNILHPMLSLVIFDEIHNSGIDGVASRHINQALVNIAKELDVIVIDRNISVHSEILSESHARQLDVTRYTARNYDGTSTLSVDRAE